MFPLRWIICGILALSVLPDDISSTIIDASLENATPVSSCLCNTYNTTTETHTSCPPSSSLPPPTASLSLLDKYDDAVDIPVWWKRKVWQASDLTLVTQGRSYTKNIKGGYTTKALVILVPYTYTITMPFLSSLIGLLGRKGWSLTLLHTGNNEESVRTAVKGWNVVHFRHSGYSNKLSGKTRIPSSSFLVNAEGEEKLRSDTSTTTIEEMIIPTDDTDDEYLNFYDNEDDNDDDADIDLLRNYTLQHQDYINLLSSHSFWESIPGSPRSVLVMDTVNFLRTSVIDKYFENNTLCSSYFYYKDTLPLMNHPHIFLGSRSVMLQITKAWENRTTTTNDTGIPLPTPTYPPRVRILPSTDEEEFWQFVQNFQYRLAPDVIQSVTIGSSQMHHELFSVPPTKKEQTIERYTNSTYPIFIDRTHMKTTDPQYIASFMHTLEYYEDKRYIVPEKPKPLETQV